MAGSGAVALCAWLLAGRGGSVCIEGVPCGPVPHFDEPTPAPVLTALRFAGIGLGNWHGCMLTAAGEAWCWGSNEYGQLGATAPQRCMNDSQPCSYVPLRVEAAPAFASLVASTRHSCGLTPAGRAWCWGFGQGGQLGDGLRRDSQVPVAVAGGHVYTQLAASLSGWLTCGLKSNGSLWCWGPGFSGSAEPAPAAEPVRWAAAGSVSLTTVSIGEAHACGLDAAGQAWCWGLPPAVGDGDAALDIRPLPLPVAGGHVFSSLSAGALRSCGLTVDGAAWCWGNGYNGALGDGQTTDRPARRRLYAVSCGTRRRHLTTVTAASG